MQEKTIAFYLQKLNTAQGQYTNTQCELLSTIETCKEYKNVILGYPIIVMTMRIIPSVSQKLQIMFYTGFYFLRNLKNKE
jgi:RNase H-like domain found in reverse transcriptase